ncbi:MAG: PHA/PHB synthase family protein [Chromatiales bacterium]
MDRPISVTTTPTGSGTVDPFGIIPACAEILLGWSKVPSQLQWRFYEFSIALIEIQNQVAQRTVGRFVEDSVVPVSYDERFEDKAWIDSPWFDYLKEYYLLCTRAIEDAIYATPGVPEKTRRRAAFWARQALDAVAPNNFLWTNPAALMRFVGTGGLSLVEGYHHWLTDLRKGEVSMVNERAFTLGRDIAGTPGAVVFRNTLLELIQYAPRTAEVRATPIVIIAPWINKYYVLDLAPPRSLIRYLVDQGFTVFVTSWKNPGAEMRDVTFDDYLTKGALAAINAARTLCGVEAIHAAGYCIGGTLLTALLAWLARDETAKPPVAHWTLLTTLVDFSRPGDIDAFITEESVTWLEKQMEETGYLDGRYMGTSFRLLRPNSLIWRYVVHNYLYGEEPPPMDVLQWNVDCTRLPAAMHSFYLRRFYLENRMFHPNNLALAGRSIDLRLIREPLYAVGTEQDHIAPWKETFRIAGLIPAPVRYTLATSGHILGILVPPVHPPKRHYRSGDATGAADPEAWRTRIEKVPGSWWEDWVLWLRKHCGPMVPARAPGSTNCPPLAPAPGTYVLEK